jgi:signal transduction histidine kinase
VRSALDELRRVVRGLRPVELEQYGLWSALQRRAEAAATDVQLTLPEPRPILAPAVEVATWRIITEAITNIDRHSHGQHARVTMTTTTSRLIIEIQDDGGHVPTWSQGVGLASITALCEELGGTSTAGPYDTGWRVRADLPITG